MKETRPKVITDFVTKWRRTKDRKDKNYIHTNQMEAAKTIFNYFLNRVRYILLQAQMQSGKAGVKGAIAYLMNHNPALSSELKVNPKNIFLLTGMNDNDLFDQMVHDMLNFSNEEIDKSHILKNGDMQRILKNPEERTNKKIISDISKNSIILIDESHYGSNKDSIIDRFLKTVVGINPNGEPTPLIKKNIYILSVSATPMAEFVNAQKSDYKEVVVLHPGEEYYGIGEMWLRDKIKPSFPLTKKSGGVRKLLRLVEGNYMNKGYLIIRANKYSEDVKTSLMRKFGDTIDIINYDAKNNDDDIADILEHKPKKPTIILLKQMLRAGKRITKKPTSKHNILMVFDSHKSNSDSIVQSLLGRCCGYGGQHEIDIYCDIDSAEAYKNWVVNEFGVRYIPVNAKNIIRSQRFGEGKNASEYYYKHLKSLFISRLPDNIFKMLKGDMKGDRISALKKKSIITELVTKVPMGREAKNYLKKYLTGDKEVLIPAVYRRATGYDLEANDAFRVELERFENNLPGNRPFRKFGDEAIGRYRSILLVDCKRGSPTYKSLIITRSLAENYRENIDPLLFITTREDKDMFHVQLNDN